MTIISIDFSILFPGITICYNFNEFKWLAIINSKLTKDHKKKLDSFSIYKNIDFQYTSSK